MDFLIFPRVSTKWGHLLATLQMKLKDLDEEVKADKLADKLVHPILLMVTTWDLLISKKISLKMRSYENCGLWIGFGKGWWSLSFSPKDYLSIRFKKVSVSTILRLAWVNDLELFPPMSKIMTKHLPSSVAEKHSAVMKSSKSALVSPMNVAFFQKPWSFHSSPRECMPEETLASRPCPICSWDYFWIASGNLGFFHG